MDLYVVNQALFLLGGITVFLLGLSDISGGIGELCGEKMKRLLGTFSERKLSGVGAGALVAAVAQSSIAVNVAAVEFVESGALSFCGAAAVIMGANVGTTMTAQILSFSGSEIFDITAVGSLVLFIGFVFGFISKKPVYRRIGRVMKGFGLLFVGLEIMEQAVKCFTGYVWMRNIFLVSDPLVLFLNGMLLTAIMQSSSAVTGMMTVLATSGMLSFGNSMFLVLGANVGCCFPVILSSLKKSLPARRAAYFNLFFNLFGAALFFVPAVVWGDAVSAFFTYGRTSARAIANFHTVFNLAVTLVLLPFLTPFTKLVSFFVSDEDKKIRKNKRSFAVK